MKSQRSLRHTHTPLTLTYWGTPADPFPNCTHQPGPLPMRAFPVSRTTRGSAVQAVGLGPPPRPSAGPRGYLYHPNRPVRTPVPLRASPQRRSFMIGTRPLETQPESGAERPGGSRGGRSAAPAPHAARARQPRPGGHAGPVSSTRQASGLRAQPSARPEVRWGARTGGRQRRLPRAAGPGSQFMCPAEDSSSQKLPAPRPHAL